MSGQESVTLQVYHGSKFIGKDTFYGVLTVHEAIHDAGFKLKFDSENTAYEVEVLETHFHYTCFQCGVEDAHAPHNHEDQTGSEE